MDLQVAKKLSDRVITVELEFLAARETRNEMIKDLKLEMKTKHLTQVEIRAVMKAAKDEITPLEKLTIVDEVRELSVAIRETRRPNSDQKPLA